MNIRGHIASVLILGFCGHGFLPISALASGSASGTRLMVEWASLTPPPGWRMSIEDTIHFGAEISNGSGNHPMLPAYGDSETSYQLIAGKQVIHPNGEIDIHLPNAGDRQLDTVTIRAVAPPQFGRNLIKVGDEIMHTELPTLLAWARPFVELAGWIVKGAGSLIKWIGPDKCVDETGTFVIDARNVGGVIVATIAPLHNCRVQPMQQDSYSIILTGAGPYYDVEFNLEKLYPATNSNREGRSLEPRGTGTTPPPIWHNDIDPGMPRYTRESGILLIRTPY
ncbi:MAG: hypothetical protein JST22_13780 [Bacteroidetes bacterium]|nr:hypothetical protein [Bacteroidota bacterium]